MSSDDRLAIWTIFFDPLDYPGQYVVRRFWAGRNGVETEQECIVVSTLEQARAAVPQGLFNIGRQPDDEQQIVESWV